MFKRFLYLVVALVFTASSFAVENVLVTPESGDQVSTDGLANKLQVIDGRGTFLGVLFYSTNAGAQYIQIHLGHAAPSAAAVPKFVWPVTAGAYNSLVFTIKSFDGSGVWIVNSTTRDTYTAGAADCWFMGSRSFVR